MLRDVSRSFHLSLRVLPRSMRRPCALGYLLARLSDTVADAPEAPLPLRREWLEVLRSRYLAESPDPRLPGFAAAFSPCLSHPGERVLVSRAGDCLAALDSTTGPERAALREVLDAITRGQLGDLDRFAGATAAAPAPLPDDASLITYADEVAGSVGRFWTDIAFLADPAFARDPLPLMRDRGTAYGRALQWINIVRDLHEDLPRGRSYLPGDPAETAPAWIDRAEEGLREGIRYTDVLRSRRLRFATALPALIGAATIRELRASGGRFLRERVRVSRAEVGAIVRATAWRVLLGRPFGLYFASVLQPNGTNASGTAASKRSGSPVSG